MSRRDEVADAAIEVLGRRGLRGLTHRAVDAAAGVPDGTTSNHFRSRATLIRGALDRMVQADLGFWEVLAAAGALPSTPDEVALATAEYVRECVGPGRVRSVARLNLFAEAAVDGELAAPLRAARQTIEEAGKRIGAAAGFETEAVLALMDLTDALIIRTLAMRPDGLDPLPALRRAARALAGEV
ncbi:TetR family transcriptional regulator [Tsukamurella sp. 8F]|uniref:TetR/AcrR family transcriptional regulator n=1 Tax=unclassified Tsukamurella TaxID=2633480 RepID=UPI0023BA0259|nr:MULTISPECIES: TetR family transcriptional regulator [unclassified Tsukamurella]MDF0532476.1 TetR family transcriptional regulator [Tsukamurella sp. 8J]MDF0589323.1 TetR family transcriptional regulator [Tsukamurella sp. 8F]